MAVNELFMPMYTAPFVTGLTPEQYSSNNYMTALIRCHGYLSNLNYKGDIKIKRVP